MVKNVNNTEKIFAQRMEKHQDELRWHTGLPERVKYRTIQNNRNTFYLIGRNAQKKQNLEKPDKFFCYIFNENDK